MRTPSAAVDHPVHEPVRRDPEPRPAAPDRAISLTILGGFELRHGSQLITLPPSGQRVVAYVALHQGPATRPNVAGTLWMDVPEDRAMANLRSALWRLRRPGLNVVQAAGEYLYLGPEVAVDYRQLVAAARRLLGGSGIADADHVEGLVHGSDLLGDWYDEWVIVEREHFRQLRLQTLEHLAIELASGGQFGRAVEAALAAVATEPLRESSHRALILVHLAQANHSEAIRQYLAYRQLMRDELGLEPSSQMDDLMGPLIRRPDPGSSVLMRH